MDCSAVSPLCSTADPSPGHSAGAASRSGGPQSSAGSRGAALQQPGQRGAAGVRWGGAAVLDSDADSPVAVERPASAGAGCATRLDFASPPRNRPVSAKPDHDPFGGLHVGPHEHISRLVRRLSYEGRTLEHALHATECRIRKIGGDYRWGQRNLAACRLQRAHRCSSARGRHCRERGRLLGAQAEESALAEIQERNEAAARAAREVAEAERRVQGAATLLQRVGRAAAARHALPCLGYVHTGTWARLGAAATTVQTFLRARASASIVRGILNPVLRQQAEAFLRQVLRLQRAGRGLLSRARCWRGARLSRRTESRLRRQRFAALLLRRDVAVSTAAEAARRAAALKACRRLAGRCAAAVQLSRLRAWTAWLPPAAAVVLDGDHERFSAEGFVEDLCTAIGGGLAAADVRVLRVSRGSTVVVFRLRVRAQARLAECVAGLNGPLAGSLRHGRAVGAAQLDGKGSNAAVPWALLRQGRSESLARHSTEVLRRRYLSRLTAWPAAQRRARANRALAEDLLQRTEATVRTRVWRRVRLHARRRQHRRAADVLESRNAKAVLRHWLPRLRAAVRRHRGRRLAGELLLATDGALRRGMWRRWRRWARLARLCRRLGKTAVLAPCSTLRHLRYAWPRLLGGVRLLRVCRLSFTCSQGLSLRYFGSLQRWAALRVRRRRQAAAVERMRDASDRRVQRVAMRRLRRLRRRGRRRRRAEAGAEAAALAHRRLRWVSWLASACHLLLLRRTSLLQRTGRALCPRRCLSGARATRRLCAVLLVQRWGRGAAGRAGCGTLRRSAAAARLQRVGRAHGARQRFCAHRLATLPRRAAVGIQRTWRGHQGRAAARRTRRDSTAATVPAAPLAFRAAPVAGLAATAASALAPPRWLARQFAAAALQRVWRGHCGRSRSRRRRHSAAINGLPAPRAGTAAAYARAEAAAGRRRREAAAGLLQRAGRAMCFRRVTGGRLQKLRGAAAGEVQRAWRGHAARRRAAAGRVAARSQREAVEADAVGQEHQAAAAMLQTLGRGMATRAAAAERSLPIAVALAVDYGELEDGPLAAGLAAVADATPGSVELRHTESGGPGTTVALFRVRGPRAGRRASAFLDRVCLSDDSDDAAEGGGLCVAGAVVLGAVQLDAGDEAIPGAIGSWRRIERALPRPHSSLDHQRQRRQWASIDRLHRVGRGCAARSAVARVVRVSLAGLLRELGTAAPTDAAAAAPSPAAPPSSSVPPSPGMPPSPPPCPSPEGAAAVAVQRVYRGYAARMRVLPMRYSAQLNEFRELSAVVLQRVFRGHVGRLDALRRLYDAQIAILLTVQEAELARRALLVQRQFRGFSARLAHARRLMHKRLDVVPRAADRGSLARTVQPVGRGMLSREEMGEALRRARAERRREEKSIAHRLRVYCIHRLQRLGRGFAARRRVRARGDGSA
eukprot:TRINITY_DN37505_c0_g1_i1.p1 TRINITY_DN37505_c0_g1~~TRINITY_DN37505_c0_g1_i1.p1  ORF type:complete len:1448 (+),score=246.13 TRINITY_DN37505_c0_g1_i1:81-4346(+)